MCKREISIETNLNGHPNLIRYVDSSVTLLDGGIHQVLLLMPFHKTIVLQMMNDQVESGFNQEQVIMIFCNMNQSMKKSHTNLNTNKNHTMIMKNLTRNHLNKNMNLSRTMNMKNQKNFERKTHEIKMLLAISVRTFGRPSITFRPQFSNTILENPNYGTARYNKEGVSPGGEV